MLIRQPLWKLTGFQRNLGLLWVLTSVISEVSMTVTLIEAAGKGGEQVLCREGAAVSVSPVVQGVAAVTGIGRTVCLVTCSHHPKVMDGLVF